ncbi:MAG TPA: FecR domain-containing protein [Steroidobacteraceae bacterium]|nr:FecR domain-containing protein [Steroidobacteraceae bacterium]
MRAGVSGGKTHPAIIAEASAWFIEFRAGDVNGDARLRFIEWLRRSPEHIHAYLEIAGAWAELPSSDPHGKIDIAALIARAREEADVSALSSARPVSAAAPSAGTSRVLRRHPRLAAFAAAAVVMLTVATVLILRGGNLSGTYSTGIGEQRTVQLSDGSTVELNARSTIQVHLTEQQRDLTLIDGQALFRVAKDKQRPFVVRAGDAQVRAVGTEFDIYKKQSATVVTVVEGRVETYEDSDRSGSAAIVLSAGEQLTVLPHIVTKPTRTDTAVATAWVQKRLIFEETSLSDVAEEFNRYNRRPLTIDDNELEKLRISGVYSSTDPASLINFLRSQNSIQVVETEKQVRVLRREAR